MSAGQPSSLDLFALDLNPKALEGLTVVITGTLPNLSRKQAQELVERSGGKVTGSISSKINLLIAGDKAGSKLKKAEELGVEVLDVDGLLKILSKSGQSGDDRKISQKINSKKPSSNSWDQYYLHYKDFDCHVLEIFIKKKYKGNILDLGYEDAGEDEEYSLLPGQYFERDEIIKLGHDLPSYVMNSDMETDEDVKKWEAEAIALLAIDPKWVESISISG